MGVFHSWSNLLGIRIVDSLFVGWFAATPSNSMKTLNVSKEALLSETYERDDFSGR